MYQFRIITEISSMTADSCDVLIMAEDSHGQTCVIEAQHTPWPIPARSWRPMHDAANKWLREYAADR